MENLEFVSFDSDFNSRENVKNLYLTAFPQAERVPYFLLCRLCKRRGVSFNAVYDKSSFAGLIYTVCHKDIVFIFYFAVNSVLRGKGYGSRILAAVKEKYPDCRFVLNIEECNPSSSNYAERLKRKEFYKKSGFF